LPIGLVTAKIITGAVVCDALCISLKDNFIYPCIAVIVFSFSSDNQVYTTHVRVAVLLLV